MKITHKKQKTKKRENNYQGLHGKSKVGDRDYLKKVPSIGIESAMIWSNVQTLQEKLRSSDKKQETKERERNYHGLSGKSKVGIEIT